MPHALGEALVDLLTRDAAELAPSLATVPPARLESLIEQAAAQGVGPLVRNRLVRLRLFDALPPPARDALDAQYLQESVRALARYHELGTLADRLAETGTRVIALKGIYLAKAVYAEPGLRPMGDMDLLFLVQDLNEVQAALIALGYEREGMEFPPSYYPPRLHQLPPFTRDGATAIEVHTRIERPSAPFAIDHDGIWERARPWPAGGQGVLALAPEDLLLHLCLHAVYHHKFRIGLNALVDIALVVERESLDWAALTARARQWRARLPVFIGLELAHRMARAKIPSPVLESLSPGRQGAAVVSMAERTLLSDRPASRMDEDTVKHGLASPIGYLQVLDTAKGLPGWREKAQFLLPYLFPTRAMVEEKYPKLAGTGWVGVMRGLHWLVVLGRFARGAVVNRRYWTTLRRMGRD
jgi:hypothetical protein